MRGIELMKYDLQLEVNEFDNHPDIETNVLLEYLADWEYRTEMMQELDELYDMEEQEEALRQYHDYYDNEQMIEDREEEIHYETWAEIMSTDEYRQNCVSGDFPE